MKRLAFWLPPLIWMAAIMWFSSGDFSAEKTGSILEPVLRWLLPGITTAQVAVLHAFVRKSAHVTEYAILAALWLLALVRERRWPTAPAARLALVVAVLWAFLDELHQATEPSRTASAADVALDAAGALGAVMVGHYGWRRVADRAAAMLLWIAALGGAAVLGLNIASGVASGVLWVTVPAAMVALVVRRRWPTSRG